MAKYVVRYDWDPEGVWFVHIPGQKSCFTQANTLAQGRKYILEVIELMLGPKAAKTATLIDDVRLPGNLKRQVVSVAKRYALVGARSQVLHKQLAARGLSKRDLRELLPRRG
jgi:predicted RNase H-like HicB family nuclease